MHGGGDPSMDPLSVYPSNFLGKMDFYEPGPSDRCDR